MVTNKQIKKDLGTQAFFVLFLCIIALRLSFTENSTVESFSLEGVFYDNFISICISVVLLLSAVFWFVVLSRNRKRRYKYTGIEIGLILFAVAAVISTYFASNRRAALNDSLTIIASIFSAVVLCQLLDSQARGKTLLFVIIAMGFVNVYQCGDQYFSSNKMLIEQYKTEPEIQLAKLGIEPGSFQQMLYEHRLYSKDIKGFFTTSNSAGCFFNLAIFSAFAVFGPGLKKIGKKPLKTFVLPVIILLVLFTGLALTASKGALLSFIIASIILLISAGFGKFFKAHKIPIFSATAAIFITAIILIVSYGLKYNTLPGGNSMLVRWQYWVGSAAMIADHFFTGVGGSNFGSFYTHYKIPEGLESVRDPHCFVLSILSSYGIIGLAGFCTALFVPIIRAMKNSKPLPAEEKNNLSAAAYWCGVFTILVFIFLRPAAVRAELSSDIQVAIYIFTVTYAVPAFFFGTTLWLCIKSRKSYDEFSIWKAPLLCGIFAVLLGNLIDFAIFEPGIMTAFWAIAALIVSQSPGAAVEVKKTGMLKTTGYMALAAALTAVLIGQYIIPVGKTAVKLETAKLFSYYGQLENASAILASAIADDRFNPAPPTLQGKIFQYVSKINPSENKEILLLAEKAFKTAIQRDRADYKNYEKLAEIYQSLAEAAPQHRIIWLEKAFDSLNQAVGLYPASSELHLTVANIAQQLNKIDFAIEHYTRAITIEDAYREQFKIMYPGKEVVSRLGDVNYSFAKEKLEQLTQNMLNQSK